MPANQGYFALVSHFELAHLTLFEKKKILKEEFESLGNSFGSFLRKQGFTGL